VGVRPGGAHDARPGDEADVLERRVKEGSRAERVLAQQIHRIRRGEQERERLKGERQEGDRERHARRDAVQEVRAVDEEVRLADDEDDPGEEVRDTKHRDDCHEERRERIDDVEAEVQPEEGDADGEEDDLADDELGDAEDGATDEDRVVPCRRQPRRLEGPEIHLPAERHRHRPERRGDEPCDHAAHEDEARQIVRADRGLEPDDAPADREGRAEEERGYDALIEGNEHGREHRPLVAREIAHVLARDRQRRAKLVHQ